MGATMCCPFPRCKRGPDRALRLRRSDSPGPLFRVGWAQGTCHRTLPDIYLTSQLHDTYMITVSDSLSLCIALFRAQAVLSRRFDGRLGSWHGMSFGDFIVLLHISRAEDGRLRRVDLAPELGLTASAVTRMLIPLPKVGLGSRRTYE